MKIHFIGIGGIGTSALAQYCLRRGDSVTGSNQGETEIIPKLREQGMKVMIDGQKTDNIPEVCDLVVYSEAISEENPERQEATKRKITQKSYFESLGEISKDFRTIAVAGTHGKTTTSGMIAAGSLAADFSATFFVGSTLKEFGGSNFHSGTNEYAVIEACEYRENFRFLHPEIIVLTNVEWDHPDYYQTEEQYLKAFQSFLAKAKTVIFHEEDVMATKLLQTLSVEKIPVKRTSLDLSVSGDHNQANAALAMQLAKYLELDLENFKQGLEQFTGAGRRQEYLGEKNGVNIFDDYAHHPTEVRATIQAMREKFPESKIVVIFEPHQFSRTRVFLDEFVEALNTADEVGLFPIYEARDSQEDKATVSIESLQEKIAGSVSVKTKEEADQFLQKFEKGDAVVFMGAGRISGFVREFLEG